MACSDGDKLENTLKEMIAAFSYTAINQYSHCLNLPIRIKKFLIYSIVIGIFALSIGHAQTAVSEHTNFPESVLDSILNSGTKAHREEVSNSASVISRRTAKMKFISEVISALEQYPAHAYPITQTALSLGALSRQYISHAIISNFPGYTDIVLGMFPEYKQEKHRSRKTLNIKNNIIDKNIEYNDGIKAEKTSKNKTKQTNLDWSRRALRISFDEINMPASNEEMGLFGLGYYQYFYPWLYGGVNAFGAATGKRGGFFTGGFTAGIKLPLIKKLYADTSLYVGAGGGGDAPQGGGLMLRPYVGLVYDFGQYGLGLGYSRVEFPNGDIDGDSISLQLDTKFSTATRDWFGANASTGDYLNLDLSGVSKHRSHISMRSRFYQPTDGSKTVSAANLNETIGVVGTNYAYFLGKHIFIELESAGAFSGNVGGYAELLGGVGLRQPVSSDDRLAFLPSVTVGGAGGGAVDTGGGLVIRGNLGSEYRLTSDLSIVADVGYIFAPDGNFEAPYGGLNLLYVMENLSLDNKGTALASDENIITNRWRIRPVHQWYLDAPRKHTDAKDLELLGAKFDWVPGNWWYLTGQALSAYAGSAGGYSEGLWGVGILGPRIGRFGSFVEALIGAGGGGGVDTGSALIAKGSAGLSFRISRDLSWELGLGRLVSQEGSLDVNLLDTALVYRLGSPIIRK